MKKIILFGLLLCSTLLSFGQSAQQEMKTFMEDGLIKWTNPEKGVSFRVGARVAMDGAYYIDQYTDRSSGVIISEARLRVFSTFARQFDTKFDIDFAYNKVAIKDMYLRWHAGTNYFVKIGNYCEPFSAGNIESMFNTHFIMRSPTEQAMGTGRAVGISFRYYTDPFWGEAGFFSQKIGEEHTPGDKGWSFSTRMLYRYMPQQNLGFHVGGSFNFRRPDANGFQQGKDKYNRYSSFQAVTGSYVDNTPFLKASIPNSWGEYRYGAEIMGIFNRFYLQAEYIGMTVDRKKDWWYLFGQQLGDLWSYPNMEGFQSWYGKDRSLRFNGCYAQVGWMILGGDYAYDPIEALMRLPGKGALQLLVRYDFTSLNDVDGTWFDGAFYTNVANGQPNNSIGGGKLNSVTIGLNYSITKNLFIKLNYNYTNLDSYTYLDNNLSTLAARLQFQF